MLKGPSYSRSKKIDESIIDVSRLDSIMQFNTFETHKITDLAWDKKNSGNNALFVFPSFFNHSCVPNLNQIFIADVTLISANRDIKENEELFISYRGECFRERKKILLDG
jgi:SET domain-containing protein